MKQGKITQNIKDRSIEKQLKFNKQKENRGKRGDSCGFFSCEKEQICVTTNPVCLPVSMLLSIPFPLHRVLNNMAVEGANTKGITAVFMLPESMEEKTFRILVNKLEEACEKYQVPLLHAHTETSPFVTEPVISLSAAGSRKHNPIEKKRDRKNCDIILTGEIAREGTALLSFAGAKQLCKRYTRDFIERAQQLGSELVVTTEAALAREADAQCYDVATGGIFGALWEYAAAAKVGLEIDLKKIPIKQHTVEICDYYDVNPYMLCSAGNLLIFTKNGEAMKMELEKAGIVSSVIGRTTAGNDKIVWNEDECRYLEPPKQDELYRWLQKNTECDKLP